MTINPSHININSFDYTLPDNRIALYPNTHRDQSKLLVYDGDSIQASLFYNITDFLPADTFLIFNNTKVIQARLIFQKETGANIEIFCLEPVFPSSEMNLAFNETSFCQWKCLVGNARRWGNDTLVKHICFNGINLELSAKKIKPVSEGFIIEFCWKPENIPFSQILDSAGLTPLPPYIKRDATESDKTTYQTIYAKSEGSVAAPTAGLHFTEKIMRNLKQRNIQSEYLTLHIGTGTFKPITSHTIDKHLMHKEVFSIEKNTLINIINNLDKTIIPVGTTSLRTIESLYWLGVKMIVNQKDSIFQSQNSELSELQVEQWDAYMEIYNNQITPKQSLSKILAYMEENNISVLHSATKLIIISGYKFKIIKGLITNFHQPKSTLLLLIAALIGNKWKEVYDYAIEHDYRFLSYGDCCLFKTKQ